MTEKVITVWERFDEDKGVWKHNHISEGYDANVKAPDSATLLTKRKAEDPTIDPDWFKGQARMWKAAKWRSHQAMLVDNVVLEEKSGEA